MDIVSRYLELLEQKKQIEEELEAILPELVGVEDPRITVTASRREKWLPIETIRFVVADEHLLASLPMRVALKKQTLRKFGYNPEELIEEITTSYRVTPNVQ